MKVIKQIYKRIYAYLLEALFTFLFRWQSGKPKIFYLMGLGQKFPNLGDQAQSAAIRIWLRKHFEMPVCEFSTNERFDYLKVIKQSIQKHNYVFLHSGGNFGDTWPKTQLKRDSVIEASTRRTKV